MKEDKTKLHYGFQPGESKVQAICIKMAWLGFTSTQPKYQRCLMTTVHRKEISLICNTKIGLSGTHHVITGSGGIVLQAQKLVTDNLDSSNCHSLARDL